MRSRPFQVYPWIGYRPSSYGRGRLLCHGFVEIVLEGQRLGVEIAKGRASTVTVSRNTPVCTKFTLGDASRTAYHPEGVSPCNHYVNRPAVAPVPPRGFEPLLPDCSGACGVELSGLAESFRSLPAVSLSLFRGLISHLSGFLEPAPWPVRRCVQPLAVVGELGVGPSLPLCCCEY